MRGSDFKFPHDDELFGGSTRINHESVQMYEKLGYVCRNFREFCEETRENCQYVLSYFADDKEGFEDWMRSCIETIALADRIAKIEKTI